MNVIAPSHRRGSLRRTSIEDKSSRTSIDIGSSTNLLAPKENPGPIPKPISKCKNFLQRFLNNYIYMIFIILLTLYALFGDDIRVSSTTVSSDNIFYSLTTCCLFFFSLEIVLSSIAFDDYWLQFFFWLDLIATLSLIPDIGWIWNLVVGVSNSASNSGGNSVTQASQISRAGRASRAGTRAGRIIRILRVIRLIRIVKLYKIAKMKQNLNFYDKNQAKLVRGITGFRGGDEGIEEKVFCVGEFPQESVENSYSNSHSFNSIDNNPREIEKSNSNENSNSYLRSNTINPIEDLKIPEESKIGKKFSELTTKRVIILVLGMLFIFPLFISSLYLDENVSYEYGLVVINSLTNTSDFDTAWNTYIDRHSTLSTPLIYLEALGVGNWSQGPDISTYRESEVQYVTSIDTDSGNESLAIFDVRSTNKLDAYLNISRTVFVCLVFALSSISLSKDAQNLVIEPIENMIQKVKKISENPLKAAYEDDKKFFTNHSSVEQGKKKNTNTLETKILEETIGKIGALLALGFGEAGSEIIATNMQKVTGEVDPMIPGKRKFCIFGFCDIKNFAEATEVLQQDIMTFVNEIAYIVHKTVDYYLGYANKNIGDSFLLVWKFSDKLLQHDEETKSLKLSNDKFISQVADLSVISFIKIMIEITINHKVIKYNDHPELNRRMPGFAVRMGFGLHQGWAIEGAIGSEFKIDASYLSPNVNLASRLEAATRQFGVNLLVSEALFKICSKTTQKKLRKVDRVTVKGSKVPLDLYTFDMNLIKIQELVRDDTEEDEIYDYDQAKVMNREQKEKLLNGIVSGEIVASDMFTNDPHLAIVTKQNYKEFKKIYAVALQDYLEGRWIEAKAGFRKAINVKGEDDGPCLTLLEFIEEQGCESPADWKGYRELHDK